MELLIFLLVIASAVARSKKNNKNGQSAREREAQRRRAIQSAWEDAQEEQGSLRDEWDKVWGTPVKGADSDNGSYTPASAESKAQATPLQRTEPLNRPSMERKTAYTPVTTAATPAAPTVLEKARKAAVSAMKELNNTVKGSMDFDSAEGESSKEGKSRYPQQHTVKPFTEASHLHTESSISGTVACPTDADVYEPIPARPAAAPAADILGSITGSELRRAVIYSEILGKPKGRR